MTRELSRSERRAEAEGCFPKTCAALKRLYEVEEGMSEEARDVEHAMSMLRNQVEGWDAVKRCFAEETRTINNRDVIMGLRRYSTGAHPRFFCLFLERNDERSV